MAKREPLRHRYGFGEVIGVDYWIEGNYLSRFATSSQFTIFHQLPTYSLRLF